MNAYTGMTKNQVIESISLDMASIAESASSIDKVSTFFNDTLTSDIYAKQLLGLVDRINQASWAIVDGRK